MDTLNSSPQEQTIRPNEAEPVGLAKKKYDENPMHKEVQKKGSVLTVTPELQKTLSAENERLSREAAV